MCNLRLGYCPLERELAQCVSDAVEHSCAAAEQDRSDAQIHCIDESRLEILIGDGSAAHELNVLVAGDSARLLESRFDSVRHEVERVAALEAQRLPRMVGDHEHGTMIGRILAPPPSPRISRLPRTRMTAEHVAAHDGGADVGVRISQELVAGIHFASWHPLHFAPVPEREHPLVKTLPTNAERVLDALIGAGDEAVDRHGNSE